jgi:hypothetical protein
MEEEEEETEEEEEAVGQDNVDTNPMYESSVVPRPQKELGHGKQ